ncbi:unnamed protein product [Arabis nemorensis]|uniref:AB hydrolase-1 domain-containing protein n=1 Tax=Arabis nemorensis TaxID=586526 RepID=A0A565AM32_9BRAS|nr:unnamed protein product [Arabis nemorensis]
MGDSSGNSNRVKLRDGAGRRAWGVYFLFYDRSGYGESDSNTKRSLESEVDDIAELADQLKIGPKLSGVAFVAPVVNYWWPSLSGKLIKRDYRRDFEPADLRISQESSVHIWHGKEDKLVPVHLQRCMLHKQPLINYHEIPQGGHLIAHYDGICDAILRKLLSSGKNRSRINQS